MIAIIMFIVFMATACGTATPAATTTAQAAAAETTTTTAAATTQAATTTAQSAEPEPIMDVVYYVPGGDPPELQAVLDAVNAKMQSDGLNLNLIVKSLGWDIWVDRTNVMLATGEPFDLLHVMEDYISTGTLAGRGGLLPLDDLINQYGPEIKKAVPDTTWKQVSVEGKIYALPSYWRCITQSSSATGWYGGNSVYLDKYGIEMPKDINELAAAMDLIKENEPDMKDSYIYDHTRSSVPIWLIRSYDSFPFFADFNDQIFCVREDGTVEAWVETPEFKQACNDLRMMYEKGHVNPDILSVPREDASGITQADSGKKIFGGGTIPQVYLDEHPGAKEYQFVLAPDKPIYLTMTNWNSNAIPMGSKNPENAVKFVNWLYSSEENHDLFIIGVEGVHYNPVDKYRVEFIKDAEDITLYGNPYHWMIGNYQWVKYADSSSDENIRMWTTDAPNVKVSIVTGFVFNPDPVNNEYSNLLALIPEVVLPMRWGVVTYDSAYDAALQQLKAAGLDAVIAEYRSQFDAWRAVN